MLWHHLTQFGDAEIAGMGAPRRLIIAASGDLELQTRVRSEFVKVSGWYQKLGATDRLTVLTDFAAEPVISDQAMEQLHSTFKVVPPASSSGTLSLDNDRAATVANAQFSLWQSYFKNLTLEAYRLRDEQWRPDPPLPLWRPSAP